MCGLLHWIIGQHLCFSQLLGSPHSPMKCENNCTLCDVYGTIHKWEAHQEAKEYVLCALNHDRLSFIDQIKYRTK